MSSVVVVFSPDVVVADGEVVVVPGPDVGVVVADGEVVVDVLVDGEVVVELFPDLLAADEQPASATAPTTASTNILRTFMARPSNSIRDVDYLWRRARTFHRSP